MIYVFYLKIEIKSINDYAASIALIISPNVHQNIL